MTTCKSLAWVTRLTALMAICLLLALPAAAQTVNGSGSWTSGGSGGKGTWQLTATSSDSTLNGTITATGTADFSQGSVSGGVDPATGSIQFGVVYSNVEEASFTGTLNSPSVSGTYTTKSGDSGTWSGSITMGK